MPAQTVLVGRPQSSIQRHITPPSGQYALTVDPSDLHGRGEAAYRVQENGKERWSATLPFTLWDAGITDDGTVAGYAYTHGQSAIWHPGEFVVVILDCDGKIRLKESVRRTPSLFVDADTANPIARGLIVDEANNRMVVRVADADLNRGHEEWWCYRLSTATATAKLIPTARMKDREPANFILDAKPIRGTPLTLVHWWRYDQRDRRNRVGARFTLVDIQAKPVWSLELPNDYSVPGNEKAEDRLRDLIHERGGILETSQLGQFDLLFAAASKKVTFSVKQNDAGTWTVKEVDRRAYAFAPQAEPKPPGIPERPLKYEGPLVLRTKSAAAPSPVRGVSNFVFDGQGRIGFLRQDDLEKPPDLVLVEQTGKVLREIPLKVEVKPDSRLTGCWVGGSRFIVANSDVGQEAKARAWSVDTNTGVLQPILGFDCPAISRLIGFADGGFVALATMAYKYTRETQVIGFDKQGRRMWTLQDDFNNKAPGALFGVKDICHTTQNEIAVLENVPQRIKLFDRRGRYLRQFDIKKAWGREPSYPAQIAPDVDGGFIIEDFHGSPPFVRMRRDGTVRAGINPKYADGRAVNVGDGIQAAPDGRLWACDGESIVRLTADGIVEHVLGEAPRGDAARHDRRHHRRP